MRLEEDVDAEWVRRLSGASSQRVRRELGAAARDQVLFRHLAREHAREGRLGYGEIAAPLELYALVRILRPRHVLEVGVSSGVSSAYLLRALFTNGRGTLHSVDRPSRPAPRRARRPAAESWSLPRGRSPGWAVPATLRARWDLRIGDKAVVLPLLAEELPEVGLFVYDVPHEDRVARGEFRLVDRRMPSGAVAIVDHGTPGERCGALADWARDERTEAVGRTGSGLFAIVNR